MVGRGSLNKSLPRNFEPIHLYEHPLQLTAYIGAANEYYQDYGIQLKHALLVVAIPEMPAEVFWFESAVIKDYWEQWEKRVAEYWERRSVWG